MNRTMILMTGLIVGMPALGQAQTAGTAAAVRAEAAVQQPPAEARIQAAMQAAAEAKVPTVLLERKVAEGRAKNVPPERIAAAVEARARALIRASNVLRHAEVESAGTAELAVAADALEAGVSESTLIRIQIRTSGTSRVVATAVLTDLVRLGHSSDVAFARVSGAVGGGANALANLRAETVASLRARGMVSVGIDGLF
jgi:hypothetical protein